MRIELNVTDGTNGVIPDDPGDQTPLISAALARLGTNVVSGPSYTKTAYFPAGIYYISDTIFFRNYGATPAQPAAFTIRGDGPDATIIKIYPTTTLSPNPVVIDSTGLARLAAGDWTMDTGASPQIIRAKTTHLSVTYDSAPIRVNGLAHAKVKITYQVMPGNFVSGMSFRLMKRAVDGTETALLTDTTTSASYVTSADLEITSTVASYDLFVRFLDSTAQTTTNLDAVKVKEIRITDGRYGDADETIIFKIQGKGTDVGTDKIETNKFLTIRDMTLDGGLEFLTDDVTYKADTARPIRWFELDRVSQVELNNVVIQNSYGHAIYGTMWGDSLLHNTRFINVGNNDSLPVRPPVKTVVYDNPNITPTDHNGSTNLKFESCIFSGSQTSSCVHAPFTKEIFYLGCLFRGKDKTGGGTATLSVPQIDIQTDGTNNVTGISLTGCAFDNWGATHIHAEEAENVLVTTSVLGGAAGHGIELVGCNGCSITANGFPVAAPNALGDVNVSGGFGNYIEANASKYSGRLFLRDQFATHGTASGAIGDLGWTLGGTTSPTVTIEPAQLKYPGVIKVSSSVAIKNGMLLQGTTGRMLLGSDLFEAIFILKFTAASSVTFSFGLSENGAATPNPTSGIYFQSNIAGTGYNWRGRTKSGGSGPSETIDLLSTGDDNWHLFRLRRIDSSTVGFSIDGGAEKALNSNVPTTAVLNPYIVCDNSNTSPKEFLFDYFELSALRND